MTLTELANKHGSDKGNLLHEAHDYAVIYEQLLSTLPQDMKLLEIGIYDMRFPGASPRMWREFLPQARLFGFDINPNAKTLEAETGIKVYLVNQEDAAGQKNAMNEIGNVDFVVDDGSHFLKHIVTSLATIWPFVSPGGYYIIEDLHPPYAQPRHYLDSFVNDPMIGFADEIAELRWERNDKLFILKKKV